MVNTKLAARYAQALLDLALEQNKLDAVQADMKWLLALLHENRDLGLLLKSPIIKADKKEMTLVAIMQSHIQELSMTFIRLVARKRREQDIPPMAEEFLRLVADYKNIQQVVLTAATRVDATLVEQVKNLTQESTGSEVEIIQRVNPALIGGFVLNIGDKQFDSSIATRIKRVKRKLTETKI